MWRIGCLFTVLLLIALPLAATKWLPVWAVVLILIGELVVIFVGLPAVSRAVIGHAANRMFDSRSSVLRGATMTLEHIEPIAAEREMPAVDDDEGPDPEPVNWIRLICRIEPTELRPSDTDEALTWDASDLAIVRADRDVSLLGIEAMAARSDGDAAGQEEVWPDQVKVLEPSDADSGKLAGSAKLEMTYACPQSLDGPVKFRYYFESIGEFLLP